MNTHVSSGNPRMDSAQTRTPQAAPLDDEAVFEALVRSNIGRMLATAKRILHDEQESHDAVQDAFLQAFKCSKDFRGQAQVSTWLHRITVNAALMRLRKRNRSERVSIESFLPTFDTTGHRQDVRPGWSSSPAALLEQSELRSLVRQRIDELPSDYRTVVLLRDIEGMSTEETANVLGLNCGAVKTRLHRARMALRTLLEADLQ